MPSGKGFQGSKLCWAASDGLKRFVGTRQPLHGLNSAQGSGAEMRERPGERRSRRNPVVRHAQDDLQRALPQYPRRPSEIRRPSSAGTVDIAQGNARYKEVGYDGMMMPDT